MSALQFVQTRGTGAGMLQTRSCGLPDCSKAGRWAVEIMGQPAGIVCSGHKSEWTRAWDAASGVAERVAA